MVHPHRLARFALLLALAVPALGAAAEQRDVEISFVPEDPTWRDEVTVVVRGTSNCDITEVRAAPELLAFRLDVLQSCPSATPGFQPFEVSAPLGQLVPLTYAVRVRHPIFPSVPIAEKELRVHEVADLVITPPPTPPTDAEPLRFTVRGYSAGCSGADPAQVEGNVIRWVFPDDCAILPTVGLQEHEVEVGPLPAGDYEVHAFRHFVRELGRFRAVVKATLRVYDDELCVPSPTALCLNDDRFRVEVAWEDFSGGAGAGQALPFRDDSGLFWFFDPDNVELTVKVLAACPVDGHHWVFVSSGSTVEHTVTVTDTLTDTRRTYENASGDVPALVADTAAFPCP